MNTTPRRSFEGRTLRHLHADEGGAVYVEYVSLTVLVGLLAAAALILVGAPLLEKFQATQLILAAPVP